MIITFIIFGVLLLILAIGKINLAYQFNLQVKELLLQSNNIVDKIFTYNQLTNLPLPVQRYFKHVLKEGQPYISNISVKHNGQFKTGLEKKWVNIKGEQYFTAEKPGFIWKGVTSLFTARDMFIADKGRLVVTLFSLFNIVDVKGDKYDQGELLRWLSESIWFPTNLLPSEKLQWFPVDSHTAKLTFNYNGLSLFYIVTFNEIGEITQLETKRYMDEKNLETWMIKLSNYRELNEIFVPTSAEAIWILAKGNYSYAKFNLTEIVYNKPGKF